jgi:chromosome segregation protein
VYLAELQIQGFKSFARRTKLIFNDGITAIVGPNGCGKSNIVDAIRWVLGEQKAGILRGDRMENVIFNGSKTMKPVGMAEVSLTIHNTKNVLPVHYSEVVITRRLFRSGESQYLLNNTVCRLKDIQNLFMDTGMGPDAYSVIELHMVEEILNGRPEDRRRIFEEAAGVTKYKLRRRAAFRKLEATEADLDRVNDIISEVEKNVNSLARQVRKARRYQNYLEELKEKEFRFAGWRLHQIWTELEPLLQQRDELNSRRAQFSSVLASEESQIEELRLTELELERRLAEKQRSFNEISHRIQKKEEMILVAQERRRSLLENHERLVREIDELMERLHTTEKQKAEAQTSLEALFGRIREAEISFDEKQARLKGVEAKYRERRARLQQLEARRLELVNELGQMRNASERMKAQREHLSQRLDTLSKQIEESQLVERIRKEKIDAIEQERAELNRDIEALQRQLQETEQGIEGVREELDQMRESLLQDKGTLQTLRERISLLQRFLENYEDHPEGVRYLLLEGALNGSCLGTLADMIEVDSKYRQALETALGEAAVSLVVAQSDKAFEGIQVLKQTEKGSVTFLPLERFSQNGNGAATKLDLTARREVHGWAYDLVKTDEAYAPVLKALLGDTLVVSDLAAAKRLASELADQHLNFVTLEGELISTWGPIRGGNGHIESGVVGRRAHVDELHKQVQAITRRRKQHERKRDELEKRLEELAQARARHTRAIEAKLHEVQDCEVKLAQLHFEMKKGEEEREQYRHEIARLQDELRELEESAAAASPEMMATEERRSELDAEYLEQVEAIGELERELDSQRKVVREAEVALVALKGDERNLQQEIRRAEQAIEQFHEAVEQRRREIADITKEQNELDERLEALRQELSGEFSRRQEMEKEVGELEVSYREHKEKVEERERGLKGLRDEREKASESLHQVELRIAELKMESEAIRQHIREAYEIEVERSAEPLEQPPEEVERDIEVLKNRLKGLGAVNMLALKEYEKEKERFDFLVSQRDDLLEAEGNLNETIRVINETARQKFMTTFEQIRENFVRVFSSFFPSGQADLRLADNEDPLEAEILIEASPKGRRLSSISLMSGGEKTLTAISLLFAVYLVKPSPFCILDEVDAPLDDTNIGRFVEALRGFSNDTQFIVVTHNKLTMRAANSLYGITMEEEGISKVVSVHFEEMQETREAVGA